MKNVSNEILLQLQQRGFEIHNSFAYYAQGSISNYLKIHIDGPYEMTSLIDEKLHKAYHIHIESASEPGYIEVDCQMKKDIYIREDKLTEWLISQGILTHEERQARLEKLRKRRCKKCQSAHTKS